MAGWPEMRMPCNCPCCWSRLLSLTAVSDMRPLHARSAISPMQELCCCSLKYSACLLLETHWHMRMPAGRLVETEELALAPGATFRAPGMAQQVERPVGQNSIGVVAWLMRLVTPECPQGRIVSQPAR